MTPGSREPPAGHNALLVEGGALRAVFSSGVLDEFLEEGFDPFHVYYGVSAGAGNIAAYLARMPGRNLRIYSDYALRPEFIRLSRFLGGGHLMDLDWLWDITIREIRLDLETIFSHGRPFVICLTDLVTGQAVYREPTSADLEHLLKASSALPVLYRGHVDVDGHPMVDGGVADPIPVAEAVRQGARNIMVIRSRKRDYIKEAGLLDGLLKQVMRRQAGFRKILEGRAERYNRTVAFLRHPPPDIRVLEICPPESFRSSRLGRNPRIIAQGYELGRAAGACAIREWGDRG